MEELASSLVHVPMCVPTCVPMCVPIGMKRMEELASSLVRVEALRAHQHVDLDEHWQVCSGFRV